MSLAPELFVDKINVPVFLAGAWQDEQTGPYFANMLDNFTGTDKVWFTVTNGAHTDSLDPAIFDRWIEFLQIYVAQVVPKRPPIAAVVVAAVVGQQVWHTSVTLPPDRFANATSLPQAQATFEADPRLRILFENGAGGRAGPAVPRASKATSAGGRFPVRRRAAVVLRRAAARSSTTRGPRPVPTRTPTTPARAHVDDVGGHRPGHGVAAAAGVELDAHPRRKRGRVRDAAARVRHRDGRDGQRRSLDLGREQFSSSEIHTARADHHRVLRERRRLVRDRAVGGQCCCRLPGRQGYPTPLPDRCGQCHRLSARGGVVRVVSHSPPARFRVERRFPAPNARLGGCVGTGQPAKSAWNRGGTAGPAHRLAVLEEDAQPRIGFERSRTLSASDVGTFAKRSGGSVTGTPQIVVPTTWATSKARDRGSLRHLLRDVDLEELDPPVEHRGNQGVRVDRRW